MNGRAFPAEVEAYCQYIERSREKLSFDLLKSRIMRMFDGSLVGSAIMERISAFNCLSLEEKNTVCGREEFSSTSTLSKDGSPKENHLKQPFKVKAK